MTRCQASNDFQIVACDVFILVGAELQEELKDSPVQALAPNR